MKTLILSSVLLLSSCGGSSPISAEQVGSIGRLVAELVINSGK